LRLFALRALRSPMSAGSFSKGCSTQTLTRGPPPTGSCLPPYFHSSGICLRPVCSLWLMFFLFILFYLFMLFYFFDVSYNIYIIALKNKKLNIVIIIIIIIITYLEYGFVPEIREVIHVKRIAAYLSGIHHYLLFSYFVIFIFILYR
jgi:hypothetical protein